MYVIAVNSTQEKDALACLKNIEGVEAILPSCIRQKRHGGVWREYESIIIPGYIFSIVASFPTLSTIKSKTAFM